MSNAKRLAKNTLYMYIRMFVLMVISLYTSRVLLKQLGVSDYGVYNVVGSIVVMFNSLRGIFASSTQRYLNFEKGNGSAERLKTIFNMSIIINLIIAAIFVVCVEIIGWWFLSYKINIDPSRLIAAKWVFQFSVFAAVISLLTTPFDAVIIANEKMGFYAGMSILEGALKLGIIFVLSLSPIDKLISYGFLLLCVQLFVRFINALYCRKNFEESHYKRCWDISLFKEMASFAGWNFLANTGSTLCNEGINMLLNVFGGPIVNAARGITYQVRSAMEQFINNVNKATDPFATKLYAKGELSSFFKMMFFISKTLFAVYTCLAVPLFIYIEDILQLWLGQVPEYAPIFIRLMLIHGMVRSFLSPINLLFYSSNKVKYYQIASLTISILLFFSSWIVLRCGMPYYSPFVVMVVYIVVSWVTFLIQARILCGLSINDYLRNVTVPTILSLLGSLFLSFIVYRVFPKDSYWFLASCVIMVIFSASLAFLVGFNKRERKMLLSIVP